MLEPSSSEEEDDDYIPAATVQARRQGAGGGSGRNGSVATGMGAAGAAAGALQGAGAHLDVPGNQQRRTSSQMSVDGVSVKSAAPAGAPSTPRTGADVRPGSPDSADAADKNLTEAELQAKQEREEEERKRRIQTYVFVLRSIAYPFNAKQSADMQRRHPKVTKEMHDKMKAKVEVRNMSRKRIKLPVATKDAFLNVARYNTDGRGQLKETLCFLAGYDTEEHLIVTDLIFPVQEGSAGKVDDLGICGQDSTLWMSQESPAFQHHSNNFRVIAWVHSHVQGAPCGFSSVDVHSQFAYKTLYHEWNVYGLVFEIRDDGSSISAWLDITEEGKEAISKCSITHVQHGSCSSRSYFEMHNNLIDEEQLPLTVIDARNTAALGSEHPKTKPIIHSLGFSSSTRAQSDFKDHDVCKACGKYVGYLKSMVGHVGHSKKCKIYYGAEYEYMKQKQCKESVKVYNQKNKEKIAEKQSLYNQDRKDVINKKQAVYNRNNQNRIKEKQDAYNKANKDHIKQKQDAYNKVNRDQINKKQRMYNKDNQEDINKKQNVYDQLNQDLIKEKQRKYDERNKEKVIEKQQRYNTINRESINTKQRRYNTTNQEVIKEKQKMYNTENQELIKERQKKYNIVNQDVIKEKQRKYNTVNQDTINKRQASYNKQNAAIIAEKEARRKIAKKNYLRDFNTQIADGPVFPCICCHRLLFSSGVLSYSSTEEIARIVDSSLLKSSTQVTDKVVHNNKVFLCINCNLLLRKGKRPCNSIGNNLALDDIPKELRLTELEQQLIAKRLLFLKIHLLPRSRMPAIKDRVINVPLEDEDVMQTLDSLPRKPDKAGLITVKLKRMKKMKTSHIHSYIRAGAPFDAIKKLKELGHPDYQFFDNEQKEVIDVSSSSSEDSESEEESNSEEVTQESTHELYNITTCLVHENLESEVIINQDNTPKKVQCGNNTIELAPGEGKIPNNILDEKDIDVKAFPTFFPSGKYGCDYERDQKISKQKYFNQRLLNVDSRFRQSASYLFAAQHIVEREQLEKSINIMVQKGQVCPGHDGTSIMMTSDNYAAFQNIRGSPKYFQTARNELLARVSQLGPFQLFFTLSCAEMRWPEVIAALLHQKGHKVICKNEENLEYVVDGQKLDDMLENSSINKHELFKENIFTVTRMFDQRVKKIIQHVLPALSEKVAPDYYNYRIEYQMRGAAHVHGVIWIEEKTMGKYRMCEAGTYDPDLIPALIDEIITCQVPNDDDELKKIIEQVQFHHHTKSCRKYNNSCRFGYPRFPSRKTIVAKPLHLNICEEERKAIMDKHKKVLKKVKTVLESPDLSQITSIADLLARADVTSKDYEEALTVSERGINIVLKRDISECFINNYNSAWLKAWNANMDIQFCFDPYAVITYICDYYGKDDSGMTDLLKDALNKAKGQGKQEVLNALKKTYLTHRQIGACEATYRILPNLHMKDSNITCTFVSTGFPENRAVFMEKMHLGDSIDDETQIVGINQQNYTKIEGRKGLYRRKVSTHERYSERPNSLKDMCLAQFATMYKVTSYQHKKVQLNNNSSIETGQTKIFLTQTQLPLKIGFERTDLSSMQLRGRACVLRLHESKKKKEEHEYYYSELLLFHPWKNEVADLFRHDAQKCKKLYKENFNDICARLKAMFPYLDSVEEAQARLEESSLQDIRPSHIAETLDIEGEHEREDDQMIGNQHAEEFASLHPGELEKSSEGTRDVSQFKVVHIDIDEMMHLTQRLIPEQLSVLDLVVNNCKNRQRNRVAGKLDHNPFRLILHGGAGSGKSNVIKIVSKWAEKILRKAGDHPNKPRVLLTAPTGTAASIIGGTTLHSAFSFSFGDDLKPLSDKKLDELRCALSDVQFVIIDEISMMRSDMLYQLHVRLCEIFQCKQLFGNRSLMLVGDLLQLQPVRGAYIFEPPHSQRYKPYHAVTPLWDEFQVIVLKHNHRQGEAGYWAEALNRFRVGEVTEQDLQMLQQKVITHDEAKNYVSACHLFFTNKEVDNHNTNMLNKLSAELHSIKAAVTVPFGCKSRSESSNRIDQTAFMTTLNVKIGARVMLIHNIDVIDSLTNGAMGKVLDILKKEEKIHCVIVEFDNPDVGIAQRSKYENISKHYREKGHEGTPIFKAEVQYQLPRGKGGSKQHTATGKLYQFPLRLAWAVTSHKVQGQTFTKNSQIVVHWHKNLSPGMAYVMLGRCESPNDVYIAGQFDVKGIRCNSKAKEMTEQLSIRSFTGAEKVFWKDANSLKIVLINIRSLHKNGKHLEKHSAIQDADIVCVTETWLRKETFYKLKSYKYASFASYGHGKGKGCALFSQRQLSEINTTERPDFQMLIGTLTPNIQIVVLYKNQGCKMSNLIQYLSDNVDFKIPTIMLGDFNIHADNHNRLKASTRIWNLVQIVRQPTHDNGSTLDHVYISKEFFPSCSHSVIPVYFSDHDLVLTEVNNSV